MIENLHGIHETVNYRGNSLIRLYNNDETGSYPVHWHTPVEIIMPLTNTYDVTCANIHFHLKPYDILMIFPGIVHSMGSDENGERIIFQIDYNVLRQINDFEYTITEYSPAIIINGKTPDEVHKKAIDILLEIKEEYNNNAQFASLAIYGKFLELLTLFARNCRKTTENLDHNSVKNKDMAEKIAFACTYINDHYSENLTLQQIADLIGFSKYHFERQFKFFTNYSFYKYLTQRRIFMAEQMLISDELSITDIALQCGFSNISTFIRMFKIINGCTPTAFRDLYVKGH